jgi:hypothetical protein
MKQEEVNAIKEFADEHFCDPYKMLAEWELCKDDYEEVSDYLYDLKVTGDYDVFQNNCFTGM